METILLLLGLLLTLGGILLLIREVCISHDLDEELLERASHASKIRSTLDDIPKYIANAEHLRSLGPDPNFPTQPDSISDPEYFEQYSDWFRKSLQLFEEMNVKSMERSWKMRKEILKRGAPLVVIGTLLQIASVVIGILSETVNSG